MHTISMETAIDPRGLVPVAVSTLQSQVVIAFDLYVWNPKDRPPRLYREKHIPLERTDLRRLLDQNITTLYTRSSDAQHYCDHVRDYVLADESIPAKDRFGALKDATCTVLMDSINSRNVDGVLKVSAEFSQDLVALVCGRKNVLGELFAVMTHDYYTFTHITNVCTYCILLAEAYGIRDPLELAAIAQGALLHDLGKCYVPARLLNKPTSLNEDEQAIMRQHPVRGFQRLCMQPGLSWGQLMMVYQHHERYDGRGYPMGQVGNEIHEWGRLCAVADVYDALTRDRSYRKGADTREVLGYMDRESGRSFDEEFCQCWIATLKQCQAK